MIVFSRSHPISSATWYTSMIRSDIMGSGNFLLRRMASAWSSSVAVNEWDISVVVFEKNKEEIWHTILQYTE